MAVVIARIACLLGFHAYEETGLLMIEGHAVPVLRCSRCGAS